MVWGLRIPSLKYLWLVPCVFLFSIGWFWVGYVLLFLHGILLQQLALVSMLPFYFAMRLFGRIKRIS